MIINLSQNTIDNQYIINLMGAIFILASKYWQGAIRAAMIAIIIFCVVN